MARVWLTATAAMFLSLAGATPASAVTQQELTLPMDDGVGIAATLHLPSGPPPAGGWPAVVLMHGLGGERSSMNALAREMGLVGEQYAVLTLDARGHGQSGGLIAIAGPREIADVRAVHSWLAARADVADARIGVFGISYGGGMALNSLVAGVRWAAVEVAQTWTDLRSALMPQDLAKSGVIGGFLTSLPPARIDPAALAVRDAAFAGRVEEVAGFAALRSSLAGLRGVRTPVFFMQGRRDFAFGIEQATRAYALLAGPKRLWIGNHGHAPSAFPAADTARMLAEGRRWFERFLRGVQNGIDRSRSVVVAKEASAATVAYAGIPSTQLLTVKRGVTVGFRKAPPKTIERSGSFVQSVRLRPEIEVFGRPQVSVVARATGGWSRIVVVLSARTPAGNEIVVSAGGVPARPGRTTYRVDLLSQATRVPPRSTWGVTVGGSSLAQNRSNLLYLDLPLPVEARLRVEGVTFRLPRLAPSSR